MDARAPKTVFLDSLDRCKLHPDFLARFYLRFLSTSSEVQQKFQDTDLARQNQMLLRSLELAALAIEGHPEALRELQERATTHDRHHLNIPAGLYGLWLEAIIRTAAECDALWSPEVEQAWRRILGFAIQQMTARY